MAFVGTVWGSLENLSVELPYNPAIPLGHISGEKHDPKEYIHFKINCSTVHNSQVMKATWTSIDRGMDKDVAHIYNGILLSHQMKSCYVQQHEWSRVSYWVK